MRKLLLGAGAALAIVMAIAPSIAEAAVTVCTGPGCTQPDSNLLFDTSQVGTSVQGSLNDQRDVMVTFTGTETLSTTSSNGQARIEGADGSFDSVDILLGSGQTFNEIAFNLNAAADGFATLTFFGAGGSTLLVTEQLAIRADGENFLGGLGEAFTGVRISTTAALDDIRQVRLGGLGMQSAVPEPGTWAMLLLGFGAMGYSLRRRRPQHLMQAA